MANYGKIARLPREIRDELNRRLDNGETGTQLLKWLNGLAQVKKLLDKDFGGREISDQNLSEWKGGGYLDWKGQQEALALTQELKANGKELAAVSAGELTESLAAVVAARYAVALYGWNGEMTDELRKKLRGLKGLSREITRLRRSDQRVEQMKIEREWLELGRQKTDDRTRRRLYEMCADHDFLDKITPKMTSEERARKVAEILDLLEEEDEQDEEPKNEKAKEEEAGGTEQNGKDPQNEE